VEGEFAHLTKGPSLYTRFLELHPRRKGLLLAAAAAGMVALARRTR
jgi:hypothetical protein